MAKRRPFLIAAAFGIALVLVAAIVVTVVVTRTTKESAPASGSASSSGATGGASTKPERKLEKIGTSAAALDVDPAKDQKYAAYYQQKVDWGQCEEPEYSSLQCGTVTVPIQWNDPSAGDLGIAVIRDRATQSSEGSLLVNPGGPGVSGVDTVGRNGAGDGASTLVDPDVSAHHDLIGFDPRGVSRSDGITCTDDRQQDDFSSTTIDWDTAAGRKKARTMWQTVIDGCEEHSGDLLPYVDTLSAARDMDVLRSAVGSSKLDYLGFSYGTYLGAVYAETYPERVGRMVLDGAMDPSLTLGEIEQGQVVARAKTLDRFIDHCLHQGEDTCPLSGDIDHARSQLVRFLDKTAKHPVFSGDADRPLTASLVQSALVIGMYQNESWDFLIQALQSAMNGDGSTMLYFADVANGRQDDGTYDGNAAIAMFAVNRLDRPQIADEGVRNAQQEKLATKYPVLGSTYGVGGPEAGQWPVKPVNRPAPIHAKGAPPIVVIGTTGDPATPYVWAKHLASQLDSGRLITWKGLGHTAYGRSGGCVEGLVDAYLSEGTVPKKNAVCS